ncbi:MAG: hypothetical protein CM15mP121_2720 [Bacteroidota bacterium]|nr:MAG: hypothetical protein CM15mP121_2720 [Bacteroidota bacterium]
MLKYTEQITSFFPLINYMSANSAVEIAGMTSTKPIRPNESGLLLNYTPPIQQ